MSKTPRPKVTLPPLNTHSIYSPVAERNLSSGAKFSSPTDTLKQSKLHLVNSNYTASPMNQKAMESPYAGDSAANEDSNKLKNLKIDGIVKRMNKKLNFLYKDKTKKFDDKIRIFENLNTFIDIKGYLKQMNTLNGEGTRKHRPPQNYSPAEGNNTSNHDSNSTNVKFANSAEGTPTSNRATGKRILFADQIEDTIKTDRESYSKAFFNREDQIGGSLTNRDSYDDIVDQTNIMLTLLNSVERKSPMYEDTDVNHFYQELQQDLVNNNFEKIDFNHIQVQQEDMDYYKNLLAFNNESKELAGEDYYKEYKARADKVILLLRKATKNIYKKVIDPKKPQRLRKISMDQITKEGGDNKISPEEQQLKEKWRKHLEKFLLSGGSIENFNEDEAEKDLKVHFRKMVDQVDKIKKKPQKANSALVSVERDQERMAENNVNHEMNKAYKNYMKTIIDCAQANETKFKIMKGDLKSKIEQLESAYKKEVQKLLPRGLESVRMTLDTDHASKVLLDKPVRKNFTRNALNALN